MRSQEMRSVYKRLLVLGVLCACLGVFGSSAFTERALTAGCIQDCVANEERCYDNCVDECSTSDPSCNSCISTCQTQFERCMRMAVYCSSGGGAPYNGNCTVHFGWHCEFESDPYCQYPQYQHQGYHQICNQLVGPQCVVCPPGEVCRDAPGGMPYCYGYPD